MNRVAFISDIDTPLGEKLAKLYIEGENRVFATVSETNSKDASAGYVALKKLAPESLQVEIWNRHSPISAKNMILKAVSHFDALDEVVLIGNPNLAASALHETSFETIEKAVDSWIKGNLFLLKPVLSRYIAKKEGLLALVCMNYDSLANPLEELIRRSFLGLAHSLLKAYGNKEFSINAFESYSTEMQEFANYIYRNISEKGARTSGRWRRFRSGILSGLKPGVKPSVAYDRQDS